MPSRLLLVLDDDRERLRGFEEIVSRLGAEWTLKTWRDAPSMIAEIDSLLDQAHLISLDHDLYRDSTDAPDPGTGRMIANLLSKRPPVCPVIVHSTNTDAAWGMHNELVSGRWKVELVHHMNQSGWIEERWLPAVTKILSASEEKKEDRPQSIGSDKKQESVEKESAGLPFIAQSQAPKTLPASMYFIRENLAVCGFQGIGSREQFRAHGFKAQLQCAGPFDPWLADHVEVMSLPFDDGAPIPEDRFRRAQWWLGWHWDHGARILISCAAGQSRSVTMAIALLKTKGALRFLDAVHEVINRVPGAYPHPFLLASAARHCGETLDLEALRSVYAAVKVQPPYPWSEDLMREALQG